jgi:hypothetical protein
MGKFIKTYESFTEEKVCSKCGELKDLKDFYKNRPECKYCSYLKNKEYKSKNKEKIKELKRRYHKSERGIEANKKYAIKYRENLPDYVKTKLRESHKKYCNNRYNSDSQYKLMVSIRSLIGKSFRNNKKSKRTQEILGCTIEEFRKYIESKFIDGMSWENQGVWHLDHIIPISRAKNEEDLIKLNHYTNFKPMWGVDNLKKGNRYDG